MTEVESEYVRVQSQYKTRSCSLAMAVSLNCLKPGPGEQWILCLVGHEALKVSQRLSMQCLLPLLVLSCLQTQARVPDVLRVLQESLQLGDTG